MSGRYIYTGMSGKIAAIFLSIIMIVTFTAPTVQAQTLSNTRPVPKMVQIRKMLEGCNYAEGEAIVVAEKGFNPSSIINGESEKLAEADEEALSLTADAARETDNHIHEIIADRADDSRASSYTVSIVHSDTLNTAALISKLYTNPKVISAEPNYLFNAAEAYAAEQTDAAGETELTDETDDVGVTHEIDDTDITVEKKSPLGAGAKRSDNGKEFGEHDPEVGDLSSAQWYLGDGGGINTLEGDGKPGFGMDLPGYLGNGKGQLNSSPNSTIAVIDSGMDVTHPDLEDRFYTFSSAQQAEYGCGEHGLNAAAEPGSQKVGDLTDVVDHGTHVTGIMGAAWDGKGTAGVANGAKLVGVRISDDTGIQSAEGNIRAFNFLINCAREINLKSVNCSWSSDIGDIEFTYTLLVNELGRNGVITVFSAGNESSDMDQKINTSSFIDSPYLLVVDSMNPAGKSSAFTNYGQTQTDVFAPGSDILSTVPVKIVSFDPFGDEIKKSYNRYHPESGQGQIVKIDFSDNSTQGVEVYSDNPVTNPEAQPVDFEIAGSGTNDNYSIKIARDKFRDPREPGDESYCESGDSVFLKVPVGNTSPEDIELITARVAIDWDLTSIIGTLYGFAATTGDNNIKMVTLQGDQKGYIDSAQARGSASAWGTATVNVGYMLTRDSEAENIYIDDEGCIVLWLGVSEERSDEEKAEAVFIDDITVGNSDAHASAHIVFNGTSMAAPTVTAALGVVAKDEKPNSQYEPGDGKGKLGEQALKRSARLRAATVHTDYFEKLCATGGYVRLTSFKDLDTTENAPLAPIIASCAQTNKTDREVVVNGWFFGSSKGSSAISVDGAISDVVSWADDKIVIKLPESIGNGAHVVRISTADGIDHAALSTSYDEPAVSTALYEYELSVPDVFKGDPNGKNGKLYPCMAVSGDYIYTLQRDLSVNVLAVWRYHIPSDTWEMIDMPPGESITAKASCLAATENGIVLRASEEAKVDEYDNPAMQSYLYYYDADSKKWSKSPLTDDLTGTAIFTRGNDVYFLGLGKEVIIDGKERFSVLSVLREGASEIEILGVVPEDYESDHMPFLSDGIIADCGGYLYLLGQEPVGGSYPLSRALTRFKLDENEKVVEVKEYYEELAEAGIIKAGVWDSTIALAGLECGLAIINRETEGTDTLLLENGSDTFTEYDRTSSFYHNNSQMAAYHDGKLYVLGYSPSEPGKIYFRATDVEIDHKWDNGKITREPSADRPGERTYTCTRCGKTRTEEIPFVNPEVTYACVYGDGSKWTRESDESLTFRFIRSPEDEAYERYKMIRIDGKEVSDSQYDIKKGSLIVSLKSSYLETLSNGKHEIEAVFNDGSAKASFSVTGTKSGSSDDGDSDDSISKGVRTGDEGKLGNWLILLVMSAAILGTLAISRLRA